MVVTLSNVFFEKKDKKQRKKFGIWNIFVQKWFRKFLQNPPRCLPAAKKQARFGLSHGFPAVRLDFCAATAYIMQPAMRNAVPASNARTNLKDKYSSWIHPKPKSSKVI